MCKSKPKSRETVLFIPAVEHEKILFAPSVGGTQPAMRYTVPGVEQWWDYEPCPNVNPGQIKALVLAVDDRPDENLMRLVRLLDQKCWWSALWVSWSIETTRAIIYEAHKQGLGSTVTYLTASPSVV